MALNKEIWQSDIVENFYPDNSFASKSVDDSAFVENHKVHIPNAGAPSNVERNRTQKPATTKQRTDNDLEYDMDELTSKQVNKLSLQLTYSLVYLSTISDPLTTEK